MPLDNTAFCFFLKNTERGQIGDVIVDIFDGEGEDLDTHPAHIGGCNLADQGGKLVSIFVDLLDGECA